MSEAEKFFDKPPGRALHKKYEAESDKLPGWIINEAHLIHEALKKGAATKEEAEGGLIENRELLRMMRRMVQLTFFVEYSRDTARPEERGDKLTELFNQKLPGKEESGKTLADFLAERRYGVSLAMSSLDDKTADAVRLLNTKKVPVVGWVVVDDAEGYWTNPANIKATGEKTEKIRAWAKRHELRLTAKSLLII